MACKLNFLMNAVACRPFTPRLCSGFGRWLLSTVLVAPGRLVQRALRCPSKQCNSSLCCSCAFSACWVGGVSTQYLISVTCISHLVGSLLASHPGGKDYLGHL